MQAKALKLEARWDAKSNLWVATCNDLPDLDIRAETMAELIAATTSLFSSVFRRIGSGSGSCQTDVRYGSVYFPNVLVH